MDRDFEIKAGIADIPEITTRLFSSEEPLIRQLVLNICEDNFLNHRVAGKAISEYVTDCLNSNPGHPGRILFLQMLFAELYSVQSEASTYGIQ